MELIIVKSVPNPAFETDAVQRCTLHSAQRDWLGARMAQQVATITFALLASLVPSFVSAEDSDERELFRRGSALLDPYLFIADARRRDPETDEGRRQIAEGIANLKRVTELNSQHWPAFWMMGKGYQAVNNHGAAYAAFAKAYQINPQHVDVARELILEAVCVGRATEVIPIAERTTELRPNDAGLLGNLGFVLLAVGQLDRARAVTAKALELAPNDRINQNLAREIAAISEGKRNFSVARYCGKQ
jgi:tetratricopeptide (TPR) repeat protein